MKKTLQVLKWILIVWGAISAVGAITLGGFLAYSFSAGNRDMAGHAEKQDVRFVLNWCRLGDERIKEVIESYQSSRSFTGDHLDAYAIKISHVDESELQTEDWHRLDQVSGVYKDAIDFMAMWLGRDEISWFPKIEEIRSDRYYIYLWSVDFHGGRPDATSLILVRPEDNMVFHFDASM